VLVLVVEVDVVDVVDVEVVEVDVVVVVVVDVVETKFMAIALVEYSVPVEGVGIYVAPLTTWLATEKEYVPGATENKIVFVLEEFNMLSYITFHVVALGKPLSMNFANPFHVAVITPLPITVNPVGFEVSLNTVRLELLVLHEPKDQLPVVGGFAVMVPVPIIGAIIPDE